MGTRLKFAWILTHTYEKMPKNARKSKFCPSALSSVSHRLRATIWTISHHLPIPHHSQVLSLSEACLMDLMFWVPHQLVKVVSAGDQNLKVFKLHNSPWCSVLWFLENIEFYVKRSHQTLKAHLFCLSAPVSSLLSCSGMAAAYIGLVA